MTKCRVWCSRLLLASRSAKQVSPEVHSASFMSENGRAPLTRPTKVRFPIATPRPNSTTDVMVGAPGAYFHAPCMKSASCMPAPRWRYRQSCSRPRVRWSDTARRCCRENRGPGAHLPPRTFMRMPEKRTFMPPQKELSCATRYGPRRRRSTLQLYAPSPSRNVISFPTGDATALKLPV
jgi:hypothetical protein